MRDDELNLRVTVSIRIPLWMRIKLTRSAQTAGSSLNAEIVRRLTASFPREASQPEQSHGP